VSVWWQDPSRTLFVQAPGKSPAPEWIQNLENVRVRTKSDVCVGILYTLDAWLDQQRFALLSVACRWTAGRDVIGPSQRGCPSCLCMPQEAGRMPTKYFIKRLQKMPALY